MPKTLNQPAAYLLVFHGSHDPRSQIAADALTQNFRDKVQYTPQVPQALGQELTKVLDQSFSSSSQAGTNLSPIFELFEGSNDCGTLEGRHLSSSQIPVEAVYLECHALPLHEQILLFVDRVRVSLSGSESSSDANLSTFNSTCEIDRLVLLPVFLFSGVHVTEDIPAEIRLTAQLLGPEIKIDVTSHLGSHPGLRRIVAEQMATLPVETWILLAHGSRRPGANQVVERLAESLGAVPAYWSVMPDLDSCIQALMNCGFRRIGVMPFFLFPGGIMDAIAQTIDQLSQKFPDLRLNLVNPLNASPQLADLLVDLARDGKV